MAEVTHPIIRFTSHASRVTWHAARAALLFVSEWSALATIATLAWQRNWPINLPNFDAASVPFDHLLPIVRQAELTAVVSIIAYALAGWPHVDRLADRARRLFVLALIGLWVWMTLSSIWAIHHGLAIVQAAHALIWVAFAVVTVCADWSIPRMIAFFMGGLLVHASVGFVQISLQHFVGLGPRLGELPVRPNDTWVSVVFSGSQRFLRAYGVSAHPNVLGGHLAVGSILALGLLRVWPKVWRALIVIAWGMIWALLLLTFSRSAWLALIAGALSSAILLWRGRQIDRGLILKALTLSLIGAILLGAFVIRFAPYLINRIEVTGAPFEEFSISERLDMIDVAARLIGAHPLTGVGAANFGVAARELLGYPLDWVHNVPLLIASDLGLPGELLFGLMIGAMMAVGVRRWRARSISMWQALLGGSLIGLAVIMLFDHYLWTAPQGTLLLAWLSACWMREQWPTTNGH